MNKDGGAAFETDALDARNAGYNAGLAEGIRRCREKVEKLKGVYRAAEIDRGDGVFLQVEVATPLFEKNDILAAIDAVKGE